MEPTQPVSDEIFPSGSRKTYALAELMPGSGPMVDKGPDDTVFSFPIVLIWELLLTLGATLAIFLFSLVKQAPLEEIANPMVTTDPAKAPWYFVGLQELLEHMHPLLAGVLIPTGLILFLIVLPYLDVERRGVGIWFGGPRGRRLVLRTALYTAVVMSAYILGDNAFSLREALRESAPIWVAQGILPAAILAVLVSLPAVVVAARGGNRQQVFLVLFTVALTSAVVFTVSGFLFRGPGFQLYPPWEMPGGYNPWDGL